MWLPPTKLDLLLRYSVWQIPAWKPFTVRQSAEERECSADRESNTSCGGRGGRIWHSRGAGGCHRSVYHVLCEIVQYIACYTRFTWWRKSYRVSTSCEMLWLIWYKDWKQIFFFEIDLLSKGVLRFWSIFSVLFTEYLLGGLKDKDTIVRWSAAKG